MLHTEMVVYHPFTASDVTQVVDWCGFPDHHPPPLALMFRIVHDMDAWLQADPDNVIVVHCLVRNLAPSARPFRSIPSAPSLRSFPPLFPFAYALHV